MSTAHALSPAPSREYEAFPNVEARNGLQERIEIPLMLRALGLERGGRFSRWGAGAASRFACSPSVSRHAGWSASTSIRCSSRWRRSACAAAASPRV